MLTHTGLSIYIKALPLERSFHSPTENLMIHSLRDLENRSQKHKIRTEVKQRFGGSCAYCGCTPPVLTLDHVVAKCKGGFDVRSNLVGACRRCNNSKKSKELWQWWQSSPWWCELRAEKLSSEVLICKIKRS